jgi:hypothetical protein
MLETDGSIGAAKLGIAASSADALSAPRTTPETPIAASPSNPKLTFSLEEELTEQQSDTIAYRFTIHNHGECPVDILSIDPRVPDGAELVKVKNSSLVEADQRRIQLADELTRILRNYLVTKNQMFRKQWTQVQREQMDEVLKGRGIIEVYANLLLGKKTFDERWKREFRSAQYEIRTHADAVEAHDRWLKDADEQSKTMADVFELKMQQLNDAEQESGERDSLATIEPDSTLAATYILTFRRSMTEPLKYQFGVDTTFRVRGRIEKRVGGATGVLLIRPRALSLSAIAVLFSLLGVVAKALIAPVAGDNAAWTKHVAMAHDKGWFLLAAIVALVFFNIYEHTKLGAGFTSMGVSWRSALVIGFLCGLANDQIVAAIRAFLVPAV